jgi:RNA polymerase sigma factor (sigma-70 family)
MTLGGLALAVGILVDDATVEIESINRILEEGRETNIKQAILDGAQQIAVPALVSTLCICIVFMPLFLLGGVARYLFCSAGRGRRFCHARVLSSLPDARADTSDTIQTFEGRSSIYSWLTRIAVNSSLMILRKQRARAEVLFDPQPDPQRETPSFEVRDSAPNPEEAYDLDQRRLKTLDAIRRLDPHLRAPIRMQLMHGRSVREISRALNIS